jgi:hypothetical protein
MEDCLELLRAGKPLDLGLIHYRVILNYPQRPIRINISLCSISNIWGFRAQSGSIEGVPPMMVAQTL